jgi:uncharacterized protein (TIGR02996 family)
VSTLGQTLEGLLTELVATPDDLSARLVLADLLTERGHPFGELMSLSASGAWTPRLLELLEAHEAAFCQLVAPGAQRAWVHRGLPEVAWYEGGELLRLESAKFPLLRSLVVDYRKGHGEVLAHPLLRNVQELTLVGGAPELDLRAIAAPLRSLTLSRVRGRGAATMLRSVPSLKRLRLVGSGGDDPLVFLDALDAARPRLDELELSGFELGPLVPRLRALSAACGIRVVRLGVNTADPSLERAWFDEPGLTLTHLLLEDEELELFATHDQGTGGLFISGRPMTLERRDLRESFVDAFVTDQRARAARSNPRLARVTPRFHEGAPAALEQRFDGRSLSSQQRWPLSRQLLEAFAELASLLPLLRPGELHPDRLVLGEGGLQVRAPWQGPPRPQLRLAALALLGRESLRSGPTTLAASAFSLGALLFTTLSGEYPQVDTSSELALLQSTVAGRVRRLSTVLEVPPALDALVAGLLQSDALGGPSFGEIEQGLRQLAATLPVQPWPVAEHRSGAHTLWPALLRGRNRLT